MTGHKGAVLELHWCERGSIVSCSADKTVATWDANKGLRTRKFAEHTGIVNSCSVARDAPHLIASGSDDCTVVLWDARVKKSLSSIYHDYQVCSVCLSHDGTSVFTGGIDNIIRYAKIHVLALLCFVWDCLLKRSLIIFLLLHYYTCRFDYKSMTLKSHLKPY